MSCCGNTHWDLLFRSICTLLSFLSGTWWPKKMLLIHISSTWLWSMATVEERIILLAQQVATMVTGVGTFAGSGTQFAQLTVMLVKSDPRIKRIVLTRQPPSSRGCKLWRQATQVQRQAAPRNFRCKEESDFKPNVWTGEKTNTSIVCVQDGAAVLGRSAARTLVEGHGKMVFVIEADVRNTGMSQDTISYLKEMDRRLCQHFVLATKGRNKELSQQHREVRIQGMETYGQSLGSKHAQTGLSRTRW